LLDALGILVLGLGFLALAGVAWIYAPRLMDSIYPGQAGWIRGLNRVFGAGLCALVGVGLFVGAITSAVETLR
jgi:hypothetical protein